MLWFNKIFIEHLLGARRYAMYVYHYVYEFNKPLLGCYLIFRAEGNKKMKKEYTAAYVWNHLLQLMFIEHLQNYPENGQFALGHLNYYFIFVTPFNPSSSFP